MMNPQDAIAILGRAYQYVYDEATNRVYVGGIGPEVHLLPYRVQDALNILQSCALAVGADL